MKIAFIGGGNMAEAMLAAILSQGISRPDGIKVSDIKEDRRHYLGKKYDVSVGESNRSAVDNADLVILAIKPQDITAVMAELRGVIKPPQLVLSIVTGATIDVMVRGLGHDRIVRVMPNTPAQVGQGMSVWTTSTSVNEAQKETVSSLLGAMGKEIMVGDEDFLDKATAVSGSGPAYLFYFVESLVAAAVSIGIPEGMASEMVQQTVLGAALYLNESGQQPVELRRMVTSPGGTTAEAIRCLEEGRFPESIQAAVRAAYQRSWELGR